jgi:hypothetical protein
MLSPRNGVGQGAGMDWVRVLTYVTGTGDKEPLARNEYLVAENRIMKARLRGRLRVSEGERGALGEIGSWSGTQGACRLAQETNRLNQPTYEARGAGHVTGNNGIGDLFFVASRKCQ